MAETVLQVENLWKQYRLGVIGTGTLREDFARFWAKLRGKEDPTLKLGQSNTLHSQEGDYVWALQDINFEVRRGEVLGIIGKNGAGKSTLLKILSKVTAPSRGQVKVKGRIASLLEVGTGFHPELTGRENIFLNGAILGMTKNDIRAKFDEIVDFSGVGKYIDTPVKRYSSGMYVRLAFAVAAHLEPEILIIDEVLAVGDAEFQKKCLGKMKDVSGEGRTVLFVSHNMDAVRSLCSRGLLLGNGKVVKDASTEEAVSYYLSNKNTVPIISSGSTNSIVVEDILFRTEEQQSTNTVNTFQKVEIKLICESKELHKGVSFAVCFNNLQESRVTSLWSSYYAKSYDIPLGKFEVVFTVPSLKLIPGEYEVITYIEANGIEIQRIDSIKNIIVSYSKEFGFTVIPTPSQGFYIENFKIEVNHQN